MKIFSARFFGGTLLVTLGLLALIIGLFSLLPPTNNLTIGIVLIIIGVILAPFGYKLAKDAPPSGSKTAVETLRQANLLDKNRKN